MSPFPRLSDLSPPSVFGVELKQLVEKETSALKVPLLIQKCVCEIERRGLRVRRVTQTHQTHTLFSSGFLNVCVCVCLCVGCGFVSSVRFSSSEEGAT